MPTAYSLELVNMSGGVLATLTPDAMIERFEEVLNEPGTLSFTMPWSHTNISQVNLMSEVRVRRGTGASSRIVWWGFVSRIDSDWKGSRFQATSLLGYFKYRFLTVEAPSLLTNGDFENTTGQTFTNGVGSTVPYGWQSFNADGGPGPWARPVSTHKFAGNYGVCIENNTAGKDMWLGQTVSGLSTGTVQKDYILSGDLHIRTDSVNAGVYDNPPALSPAYGLRGMSLICIDQSTGQVMVREDGSTVESHFLISPGLGYHPGPRSYAGFDLGKPMLRLTVPQGKNFSLDVRLYAPKASMVWDNVRLEQVQAVDGDIGQDIAEAVRNIVAFAQDPARGKSSLNITCDATTAPNTGVKRASSFSYEKDQEALQMLQTFAKQRDGVDIAVTWPDVQNPTTREFRTWAQTNDDGRGRGTVASGTTLTTAHLESVRWLEDVTDAGNRIKVESASPAGGMPNVGWASDTSTFGGVVIEKRETIEVGLPTETCVKVAEKRLRQVKNGVRPLEVELLPDATAFETREVGDVIPVSLSRGRVSVSGNRRILRKTVEPRTGSISMVLSEGG